MFVNATLKSHVITIVVFIVLCFRKFTLLVLVSLVCDNLINA